MKPITEKSTSRFAQVPVDERTLHIHCNDAGQDAETAALAPVAPASAGP